MKASEIDEICKRVSHYKKAYDGRCATCKFRRQDPSAGSCNYLEITGHSRIVKDGLVGKPYDLNQPPISETCTCYEKGPCIVNAAKWRAQAQKEVVKVSRGKGGKKKAATKKCKHTETMNRMKRLCQEREKVRDLAEEAYKQDLNDVEIAERCGRSRAWVQDWRIKQGLPPAGVQGKETRASINSRNAKALELYHAGLSGHAIERELGMCRGWWSKAKGKILKEGE